MKQGRRTTACLLACGVFAPPLIAAFIAAATFLAPDYNHLTQTMSRLGAAEMPYPQVMNAGFLVFGLLMMSFGWGLYRFLKGGKSALVASMSVLIFGLGIFLAGIFPVDNRDAGGLSITGGVHAAVAATAYVALMLAILSLTRFLGGDSHWRWFSKMSFGIVLVSLALSIVFVFDLSVTVRGLLQRFYFGLPAMWLQFMALRIVWLRHTSAASQVERKPGTG